MLLAELEAFYSRPVAPTRRLALGTSHLPADPAPGFGGILLGGVVARFARDLVDEVHDEMVGLVTDLSGGGRVPQPRMRHRLQTDRVGLQRCAHRLVGEGEHLRFRFQADVGTPAQHVLCAIYAAASVTGAAREPVMSAIRAGLSWSGPVDHRLVNHIAGRASIGGVDALSDPVRWATLTLGLCVGQADEPGRRHHPTRAAVKSAFRERVLAVHPDHGGSVTMAARRIAELSEARRILLG